jgi:TRAP-type C4-dicarboxylate transport system substrate-binding protein
MIGRMARFGFMVCLLTVFGFGFIPAAEAKPITITIPLHVTPNYVDIFSGAQKFADKINQEGKGKVEVKLYPSETLYKVKDIIPALMNGSCEIIFHTSSHTTGSWPEIGGMGLPFLFKNDAEAMERLKLGGDLSNLVNKEMDRKYGVRILAAGVLPNVRLWTANKKVEDPADVKGLKVRVNGKTDAEAIYAWGGSPNFLSSGEIFEALQRGTIDAFTSYPSTIYSRNLHEVLKYGVNMEPVLLAWGYQMYVLNKTLNSWPKDVQDLIINAAKEYDAHTLSFAFQYEKEKVMPQISKKITFLKPTPEAMQKFEKLALPTYDTWLKSVDKEFGKKFIETAKMPLKK